jgi:alpha,alpha-trehalose phosphorylase
MRDSGGRLTFAPRLPPALSRLTFRLCFQGRFLVVDVQPEEATYHLRSGEPLDTSHHGEEITVTTDAPVTRPVPAPPSVEPVSQPAGRVPRYREP